jgi:hypothetical protein
MASKITTWWPAALSFSAAIRPAGPAPMTAISIVSLGTESGGTGSIFGERFEGVAVFGLLTCMRRTLTIPGPILKGSLQTSFA